MPDRPQEVSLCCCCCRNSAAAARAHAQLPSDFSALPAAAAKDLVRGDAVAYKLLELTLEGPHVGLAALLAWLLAAVHRLLTGTVACRCQTGAQARC